MANKIIQHATIAPDQCHEPKGISGASRGEAYFADGLGSGNWSVVQQLQLSSAYPVGTVKPFAGTTPPLGWALCWGDQISRVTYARLFSAIGTSFGIGDGATTFALPDCRDRTGVGKDNMGGTSASRLTTASGVDGSTLGAVGGSEVSTLSRDNIPSLTASTSTTGSHTHTMPERFRVASGGSDSTAGGVGGAGGAASGVTLSITEAGAHTHQYVVNSGSPNTPHNNVQPTLILNMIIYHGVADA